MKKYYVSQKIKKEFVIKFKNEVSNIIYIKEKIWYYFIIRWLIVYD